jgi:CHAT domain-containing protein
MARVRHGCGVAGLLVVACGVLCNCDSQLFAQNRPDAPQGPLADPSELAAVYIKQHDFAQAEPLLRSALETTLAGLDAAAAGQSERQQLAAVAQVRGALSAYLHLAIVAPQYQELAYRYVLTWKGSVFTRQRAMRAALSEPELQPLLVRLQNVASSLSSLAVTVPAPIERPSWQRKVADLSDKKEQLEQLLASKSARYREARVNTTLEALRAVLPADTVLIDFVESVPTPAAWPADVSEAKPNLLAFVLRSSGPLQMIVLDEPDEIEQRIDDWRSTESFNSQIKSCRMTTEARDAGAWLREHLWEPLESRFSADDKTVLISPDGALSRLPFSALPGRKPGSFLIEDWPIAVVIAPQALPAQLAAPTLRPEGRLLLMNAAQIGLPLPPPSKMDDPEFRAKDKAMRDRFSQDFFSVKGIYEKKFGPQGLTALNAYSATEFAFRQHAARNRELHITAHGKFASSAAQLLQRPVYVDAAGKAKALSHSASLAEVHPSLATAMAFAPSTRSGSDPYNDGRVTAEEVQTMDLRGADLVFLVSCEAALGADRGGESMFGMQRAFHVAGARSVVAALWSVQVIATNDLSARFYDNLWNKRMTKLEALREAQLWMLRERGIDGLFVSKENGTSPTRTAGTVRLPPFFWAGFTLSGDGNGRLVGGVER